MPFGVEGSEVRPIEGLWGIWVSKSDGKDSPVYKAPDVTW